MPFPKTFKSPSLASTLELTGPQDELDVVSNDGTYNSYLSNLSTGGDYTGTFGAYTNEPLIHSKCSSIRSWEFPSKLKAKEKKERRFFRKQAVHQAQCEESLTENVNNNLASRILVGVGKHGGTSCSSSDCSTQSGGGNREAQTAGSQSDKQSPNKQLPAAAALDIMLCDPKSSDDQESVPPNSANSPCVYGLPYLNGSDAVEIAQNVDVDYQERHLVNYNSVNSIKSRYQNWNIPTRSDYAAILNVMNMPTVIEHGKKFLIMDAPSNDNIYAYINELKAHGVSDLICTCEKSYVDTPLIRAGIRVHDLPFCDGEAPPLKLVKDWLNIIESAPGAIAVHCVAGLGRAPVLVAVFLIHNGLMPHAAAQYIRDRRRGAINKRQYEFLEIYYREMMMSKKQQRKCIQRCAIM